MTWGFGVSYWYIVAGHPEYIPSKTGIYRDICDMGLWGGGGGGLQVVAACPGVMIKMSY